MKYRLGIWAIMLICITWAFLGIYGGVQICTYSGRHALIESQRQKIAELTTHNMWLKEVDKKCIKIVSMMEQILDPLQAEKEKK